MCLAQLQEHRVDGAKVQLQERRWLSLVQLQMLERRVDWAKAQLQKRARRRGGAGIGMSMLLFLTRVVDLNLTPP